MSSGEMFNLCACNSPGEHCFTKRKRRNWILEKTILKCKLQITAHFLQRYLTCEANSLSLIKPY
jgi:hypothetical protein